MDHKYLLGLGRKSANPAEQTIPIRMRAQALEVYNPSLDSDLLSKEFHALYAVQQTAAQTALGLEPHKDHRALFPPEIVLQVMPDSPGITHTRGRNDDLGRLVHIQGFGFLAALSNIESRELKKGSVTDGLNSSLVQISVEIA